MKKYLLIVTILFSGFFIGCEREENINISDLPQQIVNYISEHYPESTITEAEREGGEYEVELNTGEELIFDSSGNFVGLDD